MTGTIYRHEAIIREQGLEGEKKLAYRTQHSEPIVKAFWSWCDSQCHRPDLLPSSPLAKALKYAKARVVSLQVFLSDPDVPIDTNHLERGLRVIPTGKKNWLFWWTEIGAKRVGVIQSLLVTCKLQGVDPLHLPGRCTAAHQRALGQPRYRTHTPRMEDEVRRPSHEIRPCARYAITA